MSKVYEVHGLTSVFDGIGALVKDAEQEEDSYRMTILGAYRSPNASGDEDVLSVSFTDPPMRQFPVDIEQTTTDPTTGTISFTVFDGNYTIRKLQEEDGVWVSKYKIPLPVEALESIVDTEGMSTFMAYTGRTVQEEELTALSESDTDGPVAAVTYVNALGMFERRNGSWILLAPGHDTFNGLYGTFIDPEKAEEFLSTFDKGGMTVPEADKYQVEEDEDYSLLAAVEAPDTCPPATQDIAINLTNRENAIKTAAYGPLNPGRPNLDFWQKKADRWSTDIEEAKSSRCGNCAVFIKTPRMLDCISEGLGNEEGNDAWGAIDAGELGYCEAFDFKCASSRTCDAWVAGGPVTEEKTSE